MAYYFEADLDLQKSAQLLNAVLHTAAVSTILTVEAQIGYNTATHKPMYHNGTAVFEMASITGSETLTNKTLTSPVIDTQVTGTAILKSVIGAGSGVRVIGSASDTVLASEKAIREAIDASFQSQDAMRYKGVLDCSTNPAYPIGVQGDTYKISVAGKIGTATGVTVEVGDFLICNTDDATGGTQAVSGAKWDVIQSNVDILPTTKGGTGSNIAVVAGDLIYGSGAGSMSRLAIGTSGYYLTAGASAPQWTALPTLVTTFLALTDTPAAYTGAANYYVRVNGAANALEFVAFPSLYQSWVWRIASTDYTVTSGYVVNMVQGTGITIGDTAYLSTGRTLTINMANMAAYSLKANVTSASAAPGDFTVNTSSVVGRLGTGDIVNIPIGTAANQVAWGNHNHAWTSLSDVSAAYTSGGDATRGKIAMVNSGANGMTLSSVQFLRTTAINKLLYSSAVDTIAEVAYATATTHFLSGSMAGAVPAFRAITLADLPAPSQGVSPGNCRLFTALFETAGAAITTKTITGATHSLGTNITAMLLKSTTTDANWEPVAATVSIVKATGDVTITTKVACKGLIMIIG